jgi:tetratricopeptide (TPR) repeat protein
MRRLFLLLGCCAFAACVPGSNMPKGPSLAELRRSAEAQPQDARAWREVTMAEVFAAGGDPVRAERAAAHAQKLDPKAPEVALAQGLLADIHGHPSAALDAYLAAVELAAHSRSSGAQHLIEAASYAVLGESGMAPRYVERVSTRLMPVFELPGLALAARAALADVLVPIAYRRGDTQLARHIAARLGCASEFRVAGPFGPRELLGFDDKPPVDLTQPLAQSHDLGPGRGVRPLRALRTQACMLHLGGGAVAEAGMTLAETTLQVAATGDHVVRLDTPNSAELFVDGRSVLRVDRRKVLGARVVFSKLSLTAGVHRVLVRVSSRHPNPVLELAVAPYRAEDAAAMQLPAARADTPGLGLYLRVALALARGDVLLARQALSVATQARDASPLLLLQRAGVALSDPLLPDGVRGDDARRYLGLALTRDPGQWGPVLQLASLAAKTGRVKESIAALRKAEARWPEVPAIGLALVELLRGKSFHAAADRELARVRELVPDACVPMTAELESLRARERYAEAAALATKLVGCDAESNALYALHVERRDFAAAQHELERLRALQPESSRYSTLMAELTLAKNMNDDKAVQATIAELRAGYPRSYSAALEQVDWLVANGQKPAAIEALSAAVRAEPAAMSGLHRVGAALGQRHVLEAYRKDGAAAIKAFEASGRKYDGPQVLVLDYMVGRVFADGSSLDLIHTIQKAQSHEAIDQLAEVEVPEGAQVLTLRAIKPDGRRLEADNIANKTTISLPNVATGDYIELEYLQANAAPEAFPLGYLGERFYFKSFEVPFHHSQIVMILPADMPYKVDPRGAAPVAEEKLVDGLRVLDFHVDESVPLVEEPNSVSAREFIPSIRVGVNATFEAMVESLRDVLVDRDLYDGYYANMVREIVGEAAPQNYRLRAERIYAWVLANIENQNDVFSQAALMLRAKAGNRARVLHYLLGLAHVPSQLALARTFSGDAHESTIADADTYDHLLVRVDSGPDQKEPLWLFANERWAPFGFLPAGLHGQTALMLAPGAARVRVSEGLLGADARRFTVHAALRADGGARIDVSEALHGSEAVAWREQLEQIPQAELDHRMEQDYVARLFPGASLVSLEISGREQDQPDLVLRYVIEVKSFARPVAGGLALPSLLPSEISANFARTATRKTTELVANPVRTELNAVIDLPAGFALSGAPAPETLVGAFATRPSFSDRVSADAKTVRLQRVLSLPQMRIVTQDYPAFAEFCRRVDEVEGRELLLRGH